VVVAGTEAGRVRVGVGVSLRLSEAVLGVMPSGLMGAFLWIGIGGIVYVCLSVSWCLGCVVRCLEVLSSLSRIPRDNYVAEV
jgi:hypothetical protein